MKFNWLVLAFISMFFAGLTSVIAKFGLKGISADLGILIRTLLVMVYIVINFFLFNSTKEFQQLNRSNLFFLALSALTTAISWICYYKAIKLGDVSKVALIDKGSIVITLILSFIILHEVFTLKMVLGTSCILGGLLILIL